MTNKEKFFVGFLVLLIIIQIGVIGCLVYSKYGDLIFKEKEAEQNEPIKEETTEKDIHDTLLETISNSEYSIKMQRVTTNENNEPVNEEKEVDKSTLSEIISKLKENSSIEELTDSTGLEFPPYSYIVTYKINDTENTFKVLVTNEPNNAWVFMDNQFKLYTFNDSINDFMKNIYEK